MSDVTASMSKDGAETSAPGDGSRDPGLVLITSSALTPGAEPLPRAISLHGRALLIGRDPPRGGFAIRQSAVSRVHATLQLGANGAVRIRDMESRNGTFVNGEAIKERDLSAHDVVRIGDALFSFVETDALAHLDHPLGAVSANPSGLVGGLSMTRLSQTIRAIASGEATVLVAGETGVGKELVSRALHAASGRKGRLAAINCAAISPNLVESELFGHERGAFTGASRSNEGLVRSAEGGTLFLDEIGDMPLEAQAKLLRVLENREVLAVGATRAVAVDVRVICATHRDVPALVRAGQFRADLYARIAQRVLFVPPLRERKEDLDALVRHFLRKRSASGALAFGFMHKLALYGWPFNIRELASALQHAAEMAADDELKPHHLPDSVLHPRTIEQKSPPETASAPARRKGPSADEIRDLLRKESGSVAAVARALDRDPGQVYRWLRQYRINPDDFR